MTPPSSFAAIFGAWPAGAWRLLLAGLCAILGMFGLPQALTAAGGGGNPAAFAMQRGQAAITVDTGAGLVFAIQSAAERGSNYRPGDIISLRFHGVEFQSAAKGSHINSGFGGLYDTQTGVTVEPTQIDADHIKITVRAGDLVHTYMARRGDPAIYMATLFAREPKPGYVRFIARINRSAVPEGPKASDVSDTARTIEARDVFARADGQTRSKHYSNMRLKDWHAFGARGPHAGLYMVRDNAEGGSGGPFYRSLLHQGTSSAQELTYIVNYGEAQTEPHRVGILDCYALVFTPGPAPGPIDMHWLARMRLEGFVGPEQRGGVAGARLMGMVPHVGYTIGFANAAAQYWTDAEPGTGRFTSAGMRAGSYRMTVYKGELAVAAQDVEVRAGHTTTLPDVVIDADPAATPAVWRIGAWDGSPAEFRNGAQMTQMHPSDVRLQPWQVAPYVIGTSHAARDFPACAWNAVNSPLRIRFHLAQAPIRPMTLRVGITVAFANGRPMIGVNGWKSSIPAPSSQPKTRTLTVGTYRGNNHTFAFSIPASALKAGENEMTIEIVSSIGNGGFLSGGVAFDAIDLLP